MTAAARKVKVSVSLDADVLALVDQSAVREGAARSAVMERWLRAAARDAKLRQLENATAAYYDALTATERTEDTAIARAASRAARRLRIDEPAPRPRRS